jgi:hypothetical protein
MDAEPSRPRLDIEQFSANLVDVLLAILNAPTSVQAASVQRGSAQASPGNSSA